jgi:1-acyl-sn-glycerol-3-phosphate acyltransferase
VPVASSLGVFWEQEAFEKKPGRAVLEFLPPLCASLGKEAFMKALETAVESKTALLVAEARNLPVRAAVLGTPAGERAKG